MKHETPMLWLLAWTAASLVSCERDDVSRPVREDTVSLALHVVGTTPVDRIYEASGTIRSRQTAVVTSKVPGYVRELLVNAGDSVRFGQTLAVLEGADLDARLRAARAALEEANQAESEARAGLDAARARAALARSNYDRFKNLEAKRAATAQEMDEVESRFLAAEADSRMAEARLSRVRASGERAQAEVAAADAVLSYTRIRAPFDGRVIERRMDIGNMAAPGTALYVLEQAGPFEAEVSVDESYAGKIGVGDDAVVIGARGQRLGGRVREVFPAVDPRSRAFLVRVELADDLEAELPSPGGFARVEFRIGKLERMLIPSTAVVRRGHLDLVYVVEEGVARIRLVTLGRAREAGFEVLSGLNDGESVIENALDVGAEGIRVEPS